MQRLNPSVDIVLDILNEVSSALPHSEFAKSLLFQYRERGGLSKKQLQGLYQKAEKVSTIPVAKLATLEAIILRKALKSRNAKPVLIPEEEQFDAEATNMAEQILSLHPQHKQVLIFRARIDKHGKLPAEDLKSLTRLYRTLIPQT